MVLTMNLPLFQQEDINQTVSSVFFIQYCLGGGESSWDEEQTAYSLNKEIHSHISYCFSENS